MWFGQYGTAGVLAIQDKMGGQPTHNYTEWHFRPVQGHRRLRVLAKTILKERDTSLRVRGEVQAHRGGAGPRPQPWIPSTAGPSTRRSPSSGPCAAWEISSSSPRRPPTPTCTAMDTISAGATIAWAIEAKAKGLLDDRGSVSPMVTASPCLRAIEAIALRRGVGDLLAEGSLRAAQTLGPAAVDLTVTVKGQELPAHMPQHKRSLGLIYAVNPSGPTTSLPEHDSALRAKPGQPPAPAPGVRSGWRRTSISATSPTPRCASRIATQCLLLRRWTPSASASSCGDPSWQLYGPSETVELVKAGTGWDATMEELIQVGERRIHLLRALNAREGIGSDAGRACPRSCSSRSAAPAPLRGWR